MTRFTLPLCFIALMIVPAFAGEVADSIVTLDSLTFNLDKLKEWGTKQYTYRLVQPDGTPGEVLGKFVLSTKVDDDAVNLNDEMAINYKGKRLLGTITLQC